MGEFKKFAKNTGIYFMGNVLLKIVTFFMLPIYTKYINPTDYGTYDLTVVYITFLTAIIFVEIWSAIMRYMFDYKNDDEKKKPILSGIVIFCGSTVLFTIAVMICNYIFDIRYLNLIYLYGITMNLQNLFGFIARGSQKNLLYAVSGLIGSVVSILLNIVLIVFLKFDYSALYISSIVGSVLSSVIIVFGIKEIFKITNKYYDRSITISMLKFSLPLSINSVVFWFLTSYNKIVISNKLSLADNGLYAIAGKFSAALTIFTSCFQMAWQELSFSKGNDEKEEKSRFYSKAINLYIKFLGMGVIILIPLIYLIFPFVIDSSYSDAKNMVPLYMIATIASTISSFLGSVFGSLKKTKIIFTTTFFGSIVNVVTLHILINLVGIQASSVALFCGFMAICIARVVKIKKYIDIKVNKKLFIFLILGCILASCIYIYSNTIVNIVFLFISIVIFILCFKEEIKMIICKFKSKFLKGGN